jgi:hypothetical protein
MSKNNKNNNVVENTAVEAAEAKTEAPVVEEAKVGLGSKIKAGVKKHGKKVAGIAVGIGVGVLGYALGSKFGHGGHDDDDDVAHDYAADDYAAVEFEEI